MKASKAKQIAYKRMVNESKKNNTLLKILNTVKSYSELGFCNAVIVMPTKTYENSMEKLIDLGYSIHCEVVNDKYATVGLDWA